MKRIWLALALALATVSHVHAGFYENNATADSNTSINDIDAQGSASPANLDNLIRELAAQGKQFVLDIGGDTTVGGTADAITIGVNSGTISSAFDGLIVGFIAGSDNATTSPTANVASLGAEPIKKAVSGAETALAAGDIQSGGLYLLRWREAWDSTNGAWQLIDLNQLEFTKTGADTNVVTGTAGTSGDFAIWNGDGDLVDGPSPTGSDDGAVTGTAGTSGDLSIWNGDGDLVDGPTPPTGAIVGTSDTQTLTNKTFTTPVITLEQGTAPANTTEGRIQWDTDDNTLVVGDGSGVQTFLPSGGALFGYGVLVDVTILTTGTAATHTFTTGADYAWVRMFGPGGGGGSVDTDGATKANAAGGGGAGGYCEFVVQLNGTASATYTIGSPGTGGATPSSGSGNDGSDATDTTFAVDQYTFTAEGGLGGKSGVDGAGWRVREGGDGGDCTLATGSGSAALIEYFAEAGQAGGPGMSAGDSVFSTAEMAIGGFGGASAIGGGGASVANATGTATSAIGNDSPSIGAGGGGAYALGAASAVAGGLGGVSRIIVFEYAIP